MTSPSLSFPIRKMGVARSTRRAAVRIQGGNGVKVSVRGALADKDGAVIPPREKGGATGTWGVRGAGDTGL